MLSESQLEKIGKLQDPKVVLHHEILAFARAIEAEVRKQDDALLRQLVEALETACGDRCNAEYNPCYARVASAAGRARLEGTP